MNNTKDMPSVGYLVWRLSMKLRVSINGAVAPFGLTHASYIVLSSLWAMTQSGMEPTQRELATHTGLDSIYISKVIRALESATLVRRTPDKKDTRAVRLAMTTDGARVIKPAMVAVRNLMQDIMAPLENDSSNNAKAFLANLQTLLASPLLHKEK